MFESDGHPVVGAQRNQLGVRVHPAPAGDRADVHPDGDGKVGPGEGMSVAPHWKKLPVGLIPEHLHKLVPKARGDDNLKCFRHGEGSFDHGPVATGLNFRKTSPTHGVVESAERVPLESFQQALAATREHWHIDEEDENP